MQRFTFFVGKGGAGKTTVSSAYAVYRAAASAKSKILLLSTDPAHSLAHVFQTRLSDRPKRLQGNLYARELDAEKRVKRFLDQERGPMLELLERGSLFSGEELNALLDTSLPGMAEVAAVLALHDLLDSDYDEVIVDTAPMGHAIRLFEMPEHFARFLEVLQTAAARDVALARQFGGRTVREPAVERWSHMARRVQGALSCDGAKLVLVTTPETFSLEEAARSAQMFGENVISEIVLNRTMTDKTSCTRCARQARQTEQARKFLGKHFPAAKVWISTDNGAPVMGAQALHALAKHIFTGAKLRVASRPDSPQSKSLKFEPAEWPMMPAPLTLTLGKGGVGKTTISAAIAFHQRASRPDERVSICSIDPAPSLDDVFQAKVNDELRPVLGDAKLRAAELDAAAHYRQWAAALKAKLDQSMSTERDGLHIDLSLDRRFLMALLDVVPPGVDELFAIFRILDLVESGDRVVIDMTPTGHALEVLRTPERMLAWTRVLLKTLAAHRTLTFARDAAVELATVSQRVRLLAAMLSDQQQCNVVVVTLPEALPRLETRRLLQVLARLGSRPSAVVVNRVLMKVGRCPRCRRQQHWQNSALAEMRRAGQSSRMAVYCQREFEREIKGKQGLKRFTGELWRLL